MAKALMGHLQLDGDPRLTTENARLRARVRELENLVQRLSQDNDRLIEARAAALLDAPVQEMQPA